MTSLSRRPAQILSPLALALLVSCSQGGAAQDGGPEPAPDAAPTEADLISQAADMRQARLPFLVPAWVFTIQGALTLWGPYVDGLTTQGEAPDAPIVGAFTKGYAMDRITVGAGDPGQTEIVGNFKPVLVWFSPAGRVLRVRQVAGDQSPTQRASVVAQAGISAGPGGTVLLGGQFHGSAVFNPGTAAARSQSTESRLVGDTLHRAEDPYVVRYGQDAAPSWFLRGRTPGPLSQTWFNYGQGLAALPDGGALVAGLYESANFTFGDGTPGATTFRMSGPSYLARVNSQGSPTWVARNAGRIDFWRGVRAAADGTGYLLGRFGQGVTLLADTDRIALPAQTGRQNHALIKLTAAGAVAWVRRLVSDGTYTPEDFAVRGDGGIVVSGVVDGKLDLFADGDRVDATIRTDAPQGYVAGWRADGAFGWITPLGADVTSAGPLAIGKDGHAWVTAQTSAATRSLPLDEGGPALLPDEMTPESEFTLLYRITPAGKRAGVEVLGLNLPVNGVAATADGGLALSGVYGDWAKHIRVGASGGGWQDLPPSEAGKDQRAFFLALRAR